MDWVIIGTLISIGLLDSLIHLIAVRLTLRYFEHKLPLHAAKTSPDPDAETFSFPTTDGLNLQGCLFVPFVERPRGVVLFCPEFGSDRWSAMAYATTLVDAGFAVFAFDFRNQGASDKLRGYDPLHWVTEFEVQDILAALRYIKGRADLRDLPLGLFGISRGGGAALAAAARSPQVSCVAADGAFSVKGMILLYTRRWAQLHLPLWFLKLIPIWHVWASAWMAQLLSQISRRCTYTPLERAVTQLRRKPVLLMSGERDSYVNPEITIDLHRLSGQGPEAIWIIPDAKHNRGRQTDPADYDQHLVEFFLRMIPEMTLRRQIFCRPQHHINDSRR